MTAEVHYLPAGQRVRSKERRFRERLDCSSTDNSSRMALVRLRLSPRESGSSTFQPLVPRSPCVLTARYRRGYRIGPRRTDDYRAFPRNCRDTTTIPAKQRRRTTRESGKKKKKKNEGNEMFSLNVFCVYNNPIEGYTDIQDSFSRCFTSYHFVL